MCLFDEVDHSLVGLLRMFDLNLFRVLRLVFDVLGRFVLIFRLLMM